MTLSEELTWRGLINQTTFKDPKELDKAPITFYWGVDPSADSMTVGNLAAAMMVKTFINHGHKPVLLIGGATGLIGDPDGKKSERELLSDQQLEINKKSIVNQYKKIFSGSDFALVDNYDWFKDMDYLTFLREIGKHVPMRQMLGREFVETRLKEDGSGISYAEFSYVLIQAYDYLHLYEKMNVTLQVSGSDQWGNSIAGVDLIRRKTGASVNVFSSPLIVDPASGVKFGKSESGAIWLDPNKTTPTSFYQFWINIDDNSAGSYLKIFTDINKQDFDEVMKSHQENPGKRIAQNKLAEETTRLVHGAEALKTAMIVTDIITGRRDIGSLDDENLIKALRGEIPSVKSSDSDDVAQVLVDSGLASSKTEARQLISNRAISVNGERLDKENFAPSDFKNGKLILRRGKAFKDSALIELG